MDEFMPRSGHAGVTVITSFGLVNSVYVNTKIVNQICVKATQRAALMGVRET